MYCAGISFPDVSCSGSKLDARWDAKMFISMSSQIIVATVSWCNLYFLFHQIELASLGPSAFKMKLLLFLSASSLPYNPQLLLSILIITVAFESARLKISAFYSITKMKCSMLYPLTDSKSWNINKFHLYSVNMFILFIANLSGTLALYCLSYTTIYTSLEFLLSYLFSFPLVPSA